MRLKICYLMLKINGRGKLNWKVNLCDMDNEWDSKFVFLCLRFNQILFMQTNFFRIEENAQRGFIGEI